MEQPGSVFICPWLLLFSSLSLLGKILISYPDWCFHGNIVSAKFLSLFLFFPFCCSFTYLPTCTTHQTALIIKPLKEYHVRSVSEKEKQIDSTLRYLISHYVQMVKKKILFFLSTPSHQSKHYSIFQKHCSICTWRNEYTSYISRTQLPVWASLLSCHRQRTVCNRTEWMMAH